MQPTSWKWVYLLIGLVLRAGLLLWGDYQDRTQALPYTDVDYFVFSDAAKYLVDGCPLSKTVEASYYETDADLIDRDDLHCARGVLPAAARFLLLNDPINHSDDDSSPFRSSSPLFQVASKCYAVARPVFRLLATLGDPYARSTYRYTPFLAVLLSPIHILGWSNFGKYLFATSDVLCAVLMWMILDGRRPQGTLPGVFVHLPGIMWIANPLPAQIATRGSSEALVGLFVLLFTYFFLKSNPEAPLGLEPSYPPGNDREHGGPSDVAPVKTSTVASYQPMLPENALAIIDWSIEAFSAPIIHGLATHLKIFPVIYGVPVLAHLYSSTLAAYQPDHRRQLGFWTKHAAGIQFGLVSFAAFMTANLAAWALWGVPFIEHTFAYHIGRVDHRHNFSPYYLSSYLSIFAAPNSGTGLLLDQIWNSPLLSFGPQLLAVTALGYYVGKRDVVAAMIAQTMAFVAFNKVCTSQYFLWFLWFLPIVWPSLETSRRDTMLALAAWIGAQALWLSQAYQLEFQAKPVFARVWASGLVLFVVHAALLCWLVSSWARHRISVVKHGLVARDGGGPVKSFKTQ